MVNLKKLESDIKAGVAKYMKSEGFEDSEIPQYSKVEIEKLPDGRIKCEVRAELSYDGSFALADALDPLVAKVDPNAYFDIETPGIITAFIEGISKSGNNVIAEEKVSEYKGYSIYRVSDADKDDFEIWKNNKKVMSCETDKAAEEWIDSQEEGISETLNAILAGKSVREVLLSPISSKSMNEDDQEYWDYVRVYGSEEEREKAADYFDVSPSAFDEPYSSYFRDQTGEDYYEDD